MVVGCYLMGESLIKINNSFKGDSNPNGKYVLSERAL